MTTQASTESRRLREAMMQALPGLRRFARSLTGSFHDADDLLQSTVERMLTRPAPEDVDIEKWMYRVCRNLWIDELRSRTVRLKAAQRERQTVEPAVSGEAVAVAELRMREVDRAMAALPEEQREVLALVAIEGMAYREAAEVLEVPIGTVMSRLARARAALAARLDDNTAGTGATSGGKVG